MDEHSTHHDQPGISHHDVHEPCSSSPDTLWCRRGRSAVDSGITESNHSGGAEPHPSSTSSGDQAQEGQEGEERKEERSNPRDTTLRQEQFGKLRDGQQLYGTQEVGNIQDLSSTGSAGTGHDGDVLLRNDSNGVYLLQAGTQLDETFSSLSQTTGCPVPIFCLAGGREINWISATSTSQQSTGQASLFGSGSSDSKFQQLQRLRGILQERRQQRERSTGFRSQSKGRTSCSQLKSKVQSSMVASGNQCPCQDEDLQNLRSSRDSSCENGSSHPGLSHRRQSKQEVDSSTHVGLEAQQLPSGTRKRILGELKSLIQSLEENNISFESTDISKEDVPDIMHLRLIGEVFSTPQFSRRATKHGLQPGRAFDLQLGDQFLNPEHRRHCLQHLRTKRYGLITVSCPCTMFTNLQFMARGRSRESCMQDSTFREKLREAIVLLNFGVTVCLLQEQLHQGFLFEHPWGASSWKVDSVRRLLRHPNSILTRTDQCCFGQADAAGVPIRKRTGFVTNIKLIAQALNKTCKGSHQHQQCIGQVNGISRAAGAARYTSQMIDAILRAYCKHPDAHQLNQTTQTLVVDHLDCNYVNPRNLVDPIVHSYALCFDSEQSSIQPLPIESRLLRLNQLTDADKLINDQEAQGETSHDVYAAEILSQRQSDESMEVEDLPAPRRRSLLREIDKAHKGMGHPHQDRFLRILKAAGASPLICSLAKTYVCSQCHENQRPKPWRRAAPPRDLAFNEAVGIDCLTVKHFSIPIKCLNIVDWGTRYQMIVPLPSASAVDVRNAYRQWVKLFGAPQLIRPDLGREFMQEFAYRCSTDGTELDPSSLEAPTQNSITEREGGSFKIMFHKTSLNYGETQDMNEVLELIDSCMMMKNRLLNKDGFSAMHRVFGYTPAIPGDLFGNNSTNIVEASAMEMGDSTLQKQARMKQAAGQAFFSQECASAIQRALQSGPRRLESFVVGQKVFFWSVSVHGKVAHPNSASRKPPHQFWHGPARVVITQLPSTLYLVYQGRIIKAAPEQCRACSADEELSCSELVQSLCQTKEEFAQARIKGLHDIRDQPHPPPPEDSHPTRGRRAIGKQSFSSKEELRSHETNEELSFEDLEQRYGSKRLKTSNHTEEVSISMDEEAYVPTTPNITDDEETHESPPKKFRTLQPQHEYIDMEEGSEEEWCLEILNTDSHLIGPERCSLQTWQLESVHPNAQKPESLQSREIRLKDLNSHDLELFRNSIKKEWDTNVQAGAVAIIEPHEAQLIRQQRSHRIMQSRLLHTAKPIEDEDQLPRDERLNCSPEGTICKAKTQWIARGDKDPDVFSVESSSPVVGRDTMFMGLQLLASHQWRMHFADFSQAFMQGDLLQRNEPLYCELPSNLSKMIPDIAPGSLIQIKKTVYGLTDAPYRWNQHLDKQLKELGYVPSLLDPTDRHCALMEQLKSKYKFGKWVHDKLGFVEKI